MKTKNATNTLTNKSFVTDLMAQLYLRAVTHYTKSVHKGQNELPPLCLQQQKNILVSIFCNGLQLQGYQDTDLASLTPVVWFPIMNWTVSGHLFLNI